MPEIHGGRGLQGYIVGVVPHGVFRAAHIETFVGRVPPFAASCNWKPTDIGNRATHRIGTGRIMEIIRVGIGEVREIEPIVGVWCRGLNTVDCPSALGVGAHFCNADHREIGGPVPLNSPVHHK